MRRRLPPREKVLEVKKRKVVLVAFLLLLLALGNLASKNPFTSNKFSKGVEECNREKTQHRFSCYRSSLEKYFGREIRSSPLATVKEIERQSLSFSSDDQSYAIFGTNCHTFYHAVGDFLATYVGSGRSLEETIGYCPNQCTSGCMMGYYKRLALDNNFEEELLKNYYQACPQNARHQCAHEIGHILHDKYVTPILKPIDEISKKEYGLQLQKSYVFTKFSAADLNAPFEDCKRLVPEYELAYCYTGVGHNLFVFSEFSQDGYKSMFKQCEMVNPENKSNCYAFFVYRIGINDAATKFLSGNAEEGVRICTEIVGATGREDMKRHCYRGVGGGIGLFLDSEYANTKITQANIRSIQQAVSEYIGLCEGSEQEFKKECYKGLLGTRVKALYKELNLENLIIEELLPTTSDDFEVVG